MSDWHYYRATPTAAAQIGDLDFHVERVASELAEQQPSPQSGTIIGGSYKGQYGTAEVLFGDTYCILGDDGPPGDSYINHQALPILTTQPGDLYGPTGVERAELIPLQSGWGILYRHYTDDSPNPPPGERWMLHKTVATQTQPVAQYDGGVKFTNDGPTPGDGLGGTRTGNAGALTQQVTKGGNQDTLDDTRRAIYTITAGGLTSVASDITGTIIHAPSWSGGGFLNGGLPTFGSIIDLTGTISGVANSINHIVPNGGFIALGKFASGLSTTQNAAARYTDLNSLVTNQITQMIGNGIIQLITAIQANGGTFGSLTPAALLAALESGFPSASFFSLLSSLHGITVPGCSSKVLIQ